MTVTEWVRQILGYERETETRHADVMRGLRIGGWSHSYHYAGNHGLENTQHAHEKLTEEVQALAAELDKRLHDLTAVENELREMVMENSMPNVVPLRLDPWSMPEAHKDPTYSSRPNTPECYWICNNCGHRHFRHNVESIHP